MWIFCHGSSSCCSYCELLLYKCNFYQLWKVTTGKYIYSDTVFNYNSTLSALFRFLLHYISEGNTQYFGTFTWSRYWMQNFYLSVSTLWYQYFYWSKRSEYLFHIRFFRQCWTDSCYSWLLCCVLCKPDFYFLFVQFVDRKSKLIRVSCRLVPTCTRPGYSWGWTFRLQRAPWWPPGLRWWISQRSLWAEFCNLRQNRNNQCAGSQPLREPLFVFRFTRSGFSLDWAELWDTHSSEICFILF